MSKDAAVVKFDAGFEAKTIKGNEVHVYKDANLFASNSPVPVEEIKKYNGYVKTFNTGFISACVEDAKTKFKAGKEQVNYQAQNGVTSGNEINVQVKKACEFQSGFGEEKKTVVAPKISVAIKQSGLYNKSELQNMKADLKTFVDGLK